MDFAAILQRYDLSMSEIVFLAALVTFTTALLKKHAGMSGNLAFVGALISTVVWTVIWYLPIPKPIVAGVVVLISSTGGWQTVKDAVGKIGEDGPSDGAITKAIGPRGTADRGPSLNTGDS